MEPGTHSVDPSQTTVLYGTTTQENFQFAVHFYEIHMASAVPEPNIVMAQRKTCFPSDIEICYAHLSTELTWIQLSTIFSIQISSNSKIFNNKGNTVEVQDLLHHTKTQI